MCHCTLINITNSLNPPMRMHRETSCIIIWVEAVKRIQHQNRVILYYGRISQYPYQTYSSSIRCSVALNLTFYFSFQHKLFLLSHFIINITISRFSYMVSVSNYFVKSVFLSNNNHTFIVC